jgi:hypothetical protein
MVSYSLISVTFGQLRLQNIKWIIAETSNTLHAIQHAVISHSLVLSCLSTNHPFLYHSCAIYTASCFANHFIVLAVIKSIVAVLQRLICQVNFITSVFVWAKKKYGCGLVLSVVSDNYRGSWNLLPENKKDYKQTGGVTQVVRAPA